MELPTEHNGQRNDKRAERAHAGKPEDQPAVRGLTIPGMPANAPGMGPHVEGTLKVYTLPQAGESSRLYSVE